PSTPPRFPSSASSPAATAGTPGAPRASLPGSPAQTPDALATKPATTAVPAAATRQRPTQFERVCSPGEYPSPSNECQRRGRAPADVVEAVVPTACRLKAGRLAAAPISFLSTLNSCLSALTPALNLSNGPFPRLGSTAQCGIDEEQGGPYGGRSTDD